MFYVGIDVAKLHHFASALFSNDKILILLFDFLNDYNGFQKLISALNFFEKNALTIGLESTALYGDNLVTYLFSSDFDCIINPI